MASWVSGKHSPECGKVPPMSKRWMIGAVVGVVGLVGVVALFYQPIAIHYLLWRYRADADLVEIFQPRLCGLGPESRDPLLARFEAIGGDEDINNFRVNALHTLRCLRYDAASEAIDSPAIEDVVYVDLPTDDEAVATMVAAFDREPSAELRDQMFNFTRELDFRTRFAFHAGLLTAAHPVPEVHAAPPTVDPFSKEGAGLDVTIIRALWCEQVAPLEVERLLGRGAHPDAVTWYDRMAIFDGLLANDCDVSAPAVVEYLAFTDAPTRALELEKLLEGIPPLQAFRETQEWQLEREMTALSEGRAHLSSDTLLHDTVEAVGGDPQRAGRYLAPILRMKQSCTLARDLRQALRGLDVGDDHPLADPVQVWGVQSVARCGEEFLWSGM
jgi:hypothetical protein